MEMRLGQIKRVDYVCKERLCEEAEREARANNNAFSSSEKSLIKCYEVKE